MMTKKISLIILLNLVIFLLKSQSLSFENKIIGEKFCNYITCLFTTISAILSIIIFYNVIFYGYEKKNGYQHRKSSSKKKKKVKLEKLDECKKTDIKTLFNNLPDSPIINDGKIIIKVRTKSFDNK